jgi:hypothetical protein
MTEGSVIWAIADVTGDGAPDIVHAFLDSLFLSVNDGGGSFGESVLVWDFSGEPIDLLQIALAELTGDGLLDMVLVTAPGIEEKQLRFAPNTGIGFGPFEPIGPVITGALPEFVLHGDLDLAGGIDLLVQDGSNSVLVLRNVEGDGSVWSVDTLALPNAPDWFMKPKLMDVDGDGDLDIVETAMSSVHWRENPLDEGGQWGEWPLVQLESWLSGGPSAFGNLGCGAGLGYVCVPSNPAELPRYAHWVEPVDGFSFKRELPDLPRGEQLLMADFNVDGRDDLLMRIEQDWLLLLNVTEAPSEPAILPQLPTLCRIGAELSLPDGQPAQGQWNGVGVFENQFLRTLLPGAGTFNLRYTAYEAAGCAVGGVESIAVVDQPLISPFIGGSYCRNEAPIQLSATPSEVTWYGIEQDGVFDPATFQGSFIVAEFVDVTGEACAAESFPILMQSPLPVSINPVGPFCVNSGPQLITGSTVAFDFEWSGDIVSWNTSGAVFSPAQGPGTYTVILTANPSGPTQCPGYDTIQVVVNDQFPDIEISEIPVLCAVSGPVDLDLYATPQGGIWAGPGVSNGGFDPATVPAGAYLVTYTANLEGCLASQVASIKVLDEAEVTPSASLELCPGDDPLQFTGFPEGGSWNAPIDANGQFDPSTAQAGAYAVVYTWVGLDGCVLNAPEQTISVLTTTTVEIEPVGVLCDDLEAVPISGFPGGIWSGAAVGEGEVVMVNPVALGPGQWPLTLTASEPGQCPGSSTVDLVVEVCTGGPELEVALAEALPNPFNEEIVLRIGSIGLLHLELFDAAGRLVGSYGQQQAGGRLVLDHSGAMPGAYFLRLTPEAGAPEVLRLVKL